MRGAKEQRPRARRAARAGVELRDGDLTPGVGLKERRQVADHAEDDEIAADGLGDLDQPGAAARSQVGRGAEERGGAVVEVIDETGAAGGREVDVEGPLQRREADDEPDDPGREHREESHRSPEAEPGVGPGAPQAAGAEQDNNDHQDNQ